MNENNTLYIVVPCYKEQEVLPETSRRLKEKVLALRAQGKISDKSRIMFVNDGSSDNTWPIIRQLHEQEPDLFSGVNLSRNRGHQNALLAGLLTAVNRSGEPLTLSFPAEQALISSGGEARTGIDSLTVAPYTAAIFKISSSSPILQRRPFHASTHAAYWRSARGFLQNRSHARRSFKGKIRR